MWFPSLGGKDPLEEGMATHSSILAWRTPWTEKPGGIQSMMSKIMTSNPITSWQIEGGKVETLTDFIFLGSKITVDSHKIKRRLLLGRKAMINLDSVLKDRDITLPTKICVVKAMVFPVVIYGCESWTTKMAAHQRIDAFK